jgi:O-antigen/teichoic acid export membrane protein
MDKSILKNILINFVGLILPAFVSLVTIPHYIHLLGVERYGVINLVWALIGYFGVLDMGVGLATENQISKARRANDGTMVRIFWTAFWVNLSTGIAGGILIYFGAYIYTSYIVHISPAFQHEVLVSLPWLAVAIPVANVSWIFAGAITGMEQFKAFNINQTLGTFLFQVVPLVAAYLIAPTLSVVIAAAVMARIGAGLLLARATFKELGITRIQLPEFVLIGNLFRYGRWIVAAGGIGAITDSLDRVMVGSMLGARFVTFYAMPQTLAVRLNLLPTAMLRTLFPRLSIVSREHADTMASQALAFLNGLFTPCVIVALFALKPFLNIWVGHDLAYESAPVGRILIVAVWLLGQSAILKILIQAQASPARVAHISLLQLPLYAGALWVGIHYFGILGAGLAVVLKAALEYGLCLASTTIHPRSILANMASHLPFIFAATWFADSLSRLPLLATAGLAVLAANLAWSFYSSASLRAAVRKILTRLNAVPS